MTTEAESVKLAQRVAYWQKRLAPLGIGHWKVESVNIADETPSGPGALATVHVANDYDVCSFWFTHKALDESTAEELDQTIIHEWMHVVMRGFDQAVEAVEDHLSFPVRAVWEDRVQHEREGLVDRLATLFQRAFSEKVVLSREDA